MNHEEQPSENREEQAKAEASLASTLGANSKLTQNANGGIDVVASVGGLRGILETVLPGFVFVMVFAITGELGWSLGASIALGLIFMVLRLINKTSLVQAASGLVGILICAFAARVTGEAKDYYVPGFFIGAGYLVALLISIIVKWPLAGVLFGFVRNEGTSWRAEPVRVRGYAVGTWILIGVFVARLAVQLPMYFADNVVALGLARALMGAPLYAAGLWFAWLVSRPAKQIQAGQDLTTS